MRKAIYFVILLLSSVACFGQTRETVSDLPKDNSPAEQLESSPELAAIRSQSDVFATAFKNADAKAIAALWTEDGEYVDDTGRRFSGRNAIEKAYAEFFADNANAVIRIAIDSLRLVSPNAAIEEGRAIVEPAPAGIAGVSKYTAVHAKIGDNWLMASVRDTWIEAPVAARTAADLEWLIGTWVAEEHGVQTESDCRWVADGRFYRTSIHHDPTRRDKDIGRAIDRLESTGRTCAVVGFQPRGRACCRRVGSDGRWLAGDGSGNHRRWYLHRCNQSTHTLRRQRIRLAVDSAFTG
jgi:uncharacterized protein (TIGR02246 family)